MVVGGEPEAAPLPVLEPVEERVREFDREVEAVRPPAGLEEPEGRFEEKGVVVEVRREARPPLLPDGMETAVDPRPLP